ncbi:MAG: hypothetical protein NZ455_08585 [Bacteroidia bacterium]|nr:hypothetical protein [Bacteroidia bacterium]MDW8348456.1 hypothetical protein [Bacteroidia bacterium]
MKKLILIFILLFAGFIYAQNCRYEKNEMDKFSKTPTRITRQQTLNTRGPEPYLYVKGKNVDGSIGIGLLIQERFPTRYTIHKGDELKIALISGEVITVRCIKEDNGRRYYGRAEYYANYIITPDEVRKIISSKVDAIRIYHSEGYTSINISPNKQMVIPNVLRCVM